MNESFYQKELMSKKKILKATYIIVFLWLVLSVARLIFGYSKLIAEDISFLFVSTEEKRQMFHPCYSLTKYLDNLNSEKRIMYIGDDGFCLFTLRYYLYPTEVHLGPGNPETFEYVIAENEQTNISKLMKKVIIDKKEIYIYE